MDTEDGYSKFGRSVGNHLPDNLIYSYMPIFAALETYAMHYSLILQELSNESK
jgi:hypothetical protein